MSDKNLQLSLTPSQVSVLFEILDEIVKVYTLDPGHSAYTRSTTEFIAAFSDKEYSDILSIHYNLI